MSKWSVSFHCGYMDMSVLGRCPVGYETTVVAETREAAIEQATVKAKEFDSRATFREIHEILSFAVTVKGRTDKRRRGTFYVPALNAEDAERVIRRGYAPGSIGAQRFGGYGKKLEITKVEAA